MDFCFNEMQAFKSAAPNFTFRFLRRAAILDLKPWLSENLKFFTVKIITSRDVSFYFSDFIVQIECTINTV